MEDQAKEIAVLLKALANESRLQILCGLMEGPMPVNEIAKLVPKITLSALSQHLSLLKAHRILDSARSGQRIIYSVADYRVGEVVNVLKRCYCNAV